MHLRRQPSDGLADISSLSRAHLCGEQQGDAMGLEVDGAEGTPRLEHHLGLRALLRELPHVQLRAQDSSREGGKT